MATMAQQFLALLSACGVGLSALAYIESLSRTTIDDRYLWIVVLVVGAIALQIPMLILEGSALRIFFWKGLARGVPGWAVNCIKLAWLVALAHFVWFLLRTHYAVPTINDDQFVLSGHGRIVKVLKQKEYLVLRAYELREFAVLIIACYLTPLIYWSFRRPSRLSDSLEMGPKNGSA